MKKIFKQFGLIVVSLIIAYVSFTHETSYQGDSSIPQGGFPFIFLRDNCCSSIVGMLGPPEDHFYLLPFLGNTLFYFLLLNLIVLAYKRLRNKRNFQIQEAAFDDIPGIMEVQKAGWLATYVNKEYDITTEEILAKDFTGPERLARWKKFLLEQENRVEVVKDGNAVVAFISLEKGDKENKLGAVYVSPEYQGRGIGKQLIKQGVDWLGSDKNIVLDVVTYNDKAITIYEKMGFEKIGEPPVEDLAKLPSGKTMPEVRMILRHS
ncbi:MAG: GNAT family N-acetyltransferase [Candidatus Magasanikbacteria bacterium]|nr:GNAT family N-acetyltransferase [Candidatus Magasanikbacteria bacterium]